MVNNSWGSCPQYPCHPYWSIYPPLNPAPMWNDNPYTYTTTVFMPHKIVDPPDIEEICKHKPKLCGSFEELNRNKHK